MIPGVGCCGRFLIPGMGGCGRLLNPDTRLTSATVVDEGFTVVPTNRMWVAANPSYVVHKAQGG
jgi:hypothetical protein